MSVSVSVSMSDLVSLYTLTNVGFSRGFAAICRAGWEEAATDRTNVVLVNRVAMVVRRARR